MSSLPVDKLSDILVRWAARFGHFHSPCVASCLEPPGVLFRINTSRFTDSGLFDQALRALLLESVLWTMVPVSWLTSTAKVAQLVTTWVLTYWDVTVYRLRDSCAGFSFSGIDAVNLGAEVWTRGHLGFCRIKTSRMTGFGRNWDSLTRHRNLFCFLRKGWKTKPTW